MKRMLVTALLGALAVSSSSLEVAHAAPKKKAKAAQEAPQSAEIAKSMGDLKWGMGRDEVLNHFANAIKEKYKPLLAKASGALEEDKLRARMRDELGKLKSSLVEFNGKKTGWDVSFLKGEFTHHNGESLFVVTDDASENYYFFIQNKLWKWYKAFKADAFQGKSFEQFGEAIQGRYGKSVKREGEATHGGGKQSWLEWQDSETRLRAVDNKQFYGFYCLVFEDKATLRKLPQLRTTKVSEEKKGNSLVDSVTGGDESSDNNPDVIDRITGKIRRRQDAPEPSKPGGSKPAPTPAPSSDPVSSEDDPLKGL
jgi:hypothetical protein